MFDIISIGSATRDIFIGTDDFKSFKSDEYSSGQAMCFSLGSKLEIKKLVLTSGGGGTNAAVTFAGQGFKTACIGVVGKDLNGREILNELENEGVDTQYFQKHDDDLTAYSVVLVDKSGERTILSYKGEGQHLEAARIPFDKLRARWLFLDSLGGHYDILEGAISWAVKNGVKIASNPGSKELAHGLDKLKPLLKNISIFWLNQEEAAGLLGLDINNEKEIFQTMDSLIDGVFVMTKGPKGMAVSDSKNIYTARVPDSPVVERTGAGDASCSGFISEYMRSGDIIKAIQYGTANASSVVAQYGAKAGILKKDDWGQWEPVKVEQIQL